MCKQVFIGITKRGTREAKLASKGTKMGFKRSTNERFWMLNTNSEGAELFGTPTKKNMSIAPAQAYEP